MIKTIEKLSSSFRDPSGFVFLKDGRLYRQINQSYKDNYDLLLSSKLYDSLIENKQLIPHEEVSVEPFDAKQAYKVVQPQEVPFISYPFEWCFSQLKDAALLTMDVVLAALDAGMILKDASAYNVQFLNGKPILVDTLSFEKYIDGQPWIGYRQFCQHFLAPLALMAYKDTRLSKFSAVYIDGIPMDLASSLLPGSTWFNHRLLTHLHLHSRWQGQSGENSGKPSAKMPKEALKALLQDVRSSVAELKVRSVHSVWADYTQNNNYEAVSSAHKKKLAAQFLEKINPKTVMDLGANTGDYSRLASTSTLVVSADLDHDSVEMNYNRCLSEGRRNILPMVVDLTNPTASLGFENKERLSFLERGKADFVMALALIHHMAIANNVPLAKIAQFFSSMAPYLLVEFVPKDDSQVERLLQSREDIFPDYTQEGFEAAFKEYYSIVDAVDIEGSKRRLYLLKTADA
ncbi:MAG: hypothetical protein K2Y22_12935 [Candidatus Obscuribacterales bacterium]|nr:hypothetical protein [Candidatus Obscuribacterales bacterium]